MLNQPPARQAVDEFFASGSGSIGLGAVKDRRRYRNSQARRDDGPGNHRVSRNVGCGNHGGFPADYVSELISRAYGLPAPPASSSASGSRGLAPRGPRSGVVSLVECRARRNLTDPA
jgi:hypothetical protein